MGSCLCSLRKGGMRSYYDLSKRSQKGKEKALGKKYIKASIVIISGRWDYRCLLLSYICSSADSYSIRNAYVIITEVTQTK